MGPKTGYLSLHITTFAPHTAPGGSYWADYPPEDLRTELPCRLIQTINWAYQGPQYPYPYPNEHPCHAEQHPWVI